MLGLSLTEILVIAAIVLLLFGGKRLPEIGTGLGKTVGELRRIRDERKAGKEKRGKDQKESLISDLRKEVEAIPGLKEVKEIKEAAEKVKNITKILK